MIKLLSLFSGIGAFEAALRRGGYQFETVNYCEIDPYASKAYSQIHGISEDFNLHDVRTVNPLLMNDVNLVTFGFPCQDMSVAGKRAGLKGSRSNLFYEAIRIIREMRIKTNGRYPRYIVWGNGVALPCVQFIMHQIAERDAEEEWHRQVMEEMTIQQLMEQEPELFEV